MTQERVSMRKVMEVLRLRFGLGKSQREIKQICGIGKTTVQDYIRRAETAGIGWPLPWEMTETELENALFSDNAVNKSDKQIPYEYIYEELRKPNVTLSLLWEEYKQTNPDGYQYSWFSELVRKYIGTVSYSMRQEYKAGEKVFVDFADGLAVIDMVTNSPTCLRATRKQEKTQIFVAVWGASKYTYVEAVMRQDMASWIKANVNMLEYFGVSPKAIVPDNLKSAVIKACWYEPEINPTYREFAEHYGITIFPARSGKPKDKAPAENGVRLVKRWILARLRNRQFYSCTELNVAIRELLKDLNGRKMKKIGKSRRELFESLDKPHANTLPDSPYEYAQWKKAKVGINYHVCFDKHNYSAPYTYIHKEVEIKGSTTLVEAYYKGERICSHPRSSINNGYSTLREHMPPSHQKYLDWTPKRILEWAQKYGENVCSVVKRIMESRSFPEQSYKSCLGIIRLERHYTAERLNKACKRAITYDAISYKSVKNILQNGMDLSEEEKPACQTLIRHDNIRGKEYFNQTMEVNQ